MKKLLNSIFASVFLATFSISHVNASGDFFDLNSYTGYPPKRNFDVVAENIAVAKSQPHSKVRYFLTQFTGKLFLDESMGEFRASMAKENKLLLDNKKEASITETLKSKERPIYKVEQWYGGFQDDVPSDVMKLIFTKASEKGVDPRDLELVCKNWYNSMRSPISESRTPMSGVFGHDYITKRNDFFMEVCVHRYWGSPLNGLTLTYTDPKTKGVKPLKNPNFEHILNGTFDLSSCGETSKHLRITTSVTEFFKVREENKNMLVVLVSTYGLINNLRAKKNGDVKNWKSAVAPVGLFWRWGNWEDLTWYNYLVTSSMEDLESNNLYARLGLASVTCSASVLAFSRKGDRGLALRAFTFHFQTQSAAYLA